MRAVYDAISAALAPTQTYYVDALTSTTYPYVLVIPAGTTPHGDVPACGDAASLVGTYRLTSAGRTSTVADSTAESTKAALCGSRRAALAIPGYSASIRWLRTEMADVDRDVTLPDINRHPAYRVDTYRVDLTPL